MTATNGCIAGTGNDTINFSVTGTILLGSSLPEVTDSLTITGPAAPGISISGGGDVLVTSVASGATLYLNYLTIANGSAINGGAIYNNGTLTVSNSTFSTSNNLGVLSDQGGAIYTNGTLTVTNSTFSGNTARYYGGGIYNNGTLTVTNSTFSGNYGGFDGGGIYSDGTLSVTNSIFSGNYSRFGGGGISGTYIPRAKVKNTILAANAGGNCGGVKDEGYNISDDATCSFSAPGSLNNTDPMLDPNGLQSNGGPTQTIALLTGSPAIDAIPLADCTDQASTPNPIITDQRGFPRSDGAETNCDIGAYEVQDTASTPFLWFSGTLTITPDTGVFQLHSRFKLGAGGSIDPATQPVTFGLGRYAVRVPAGSFVPDGSGYLFHETISGRFLRVFIEPINMPGIYALIADGGTHHTSICGSSNPMPVTLTIGDYFGSAKINPTLE
jgi:predicted outer membrane repeat protein